jgi:hypothetical protein
MLRALKLIVLRPWLQTIVFFCREIGARQSSASETRYDWTRMSDSIFACGIVMSIESFGINIAGRQV